MTGRFVSNRFFSSALVALTISAGNAGHALAQSVDAGAPDGGGAGVA